MGLIKNIFKEIKESKGREELSLISYIVATIIMATGFLSPFIIYFVIKEVF